MVFCSNKQKSAQRANILFLFSDVNSSPILIEIVKKVHLSGYSCRVLVIGEMNLEICKRLKELGIEPCVVSKKSKYALPLMLASISRYVFIFRPSTILASGQYATILGMTISYLMRVSRRVFIRHHSNFHLKNRMYLGMFTDRLANFLATHIVAVSEVVKEILLIDERVSAKKVVLIHNGVDLVGFAKTGHSGVNFSAQQKKIFRIGVVSRLTGWKGIQFTVDAFLMLKVRYPNTRLDIVGAPSDSFLHIREKLSVLDESEYSLTDWHPDIFGFLNEIDVFVHVPIGPQDEAFGLVYVEALASGTPCIFTLSGILNELPKPEKYAHIVSFGDSDAILNKLIEIIERGAWNLQLVPQEWLQQYSLPNMGKKYLHLLVGLDEDEH
jgi:glycosyltransferase involved in cell wall biosynthesis